MTLSVTDLFCGAGGSSLGAEMAGTTLQLGLNHWDRAIETHARNFQHADHECADVASLTTAQIRRYPDSDILLASPECTNHSLAKGARRRKPQVPSMWEDGPAGDSEQDRSRATMWDVVRFAEQKLLKGRPYKAIVVENVVDVYRWGFDDDGGLFQAWLQAMRALGYEHELVWLNSMFCPPTPQSRDRLYVVFWRRGMRGPNLRVEPPAWCPACERIVSGRQSFKQSKGRRPVGKRYGVQYVYTCPECGGTVLPGAFPAASAIDWQLPAERIGDRTRPLAVATRERIRRGLERLAREPFAIRLLQGGNPRPLTLPLVTLTRRHDMGVVLPVAGNTFERTPGNRARRAEFQPADTVHGTLDRALVVPPTVGQDQALVYSNRANNVPRPAGEQPTHPVLTGAHLGVVELQAHGGVRSAGQPVHTVRAGGRHHAVVVAHYDPGWARRAQEEPFGTVTARDHHSLVVPYDRTGEAFDGEIEPARTLTTRDRLALVVPDDEAAAPELIAVDWSDEDIDDCRFRMFALHEIAETMAMALHVNGGEYVVLGNKRERMSQYGNAVTPPVAALLVERLLESVGG